MPIKNGDTVKVHYKGTLDDGEVFDESTDHGPLEFTVGKHQVVPGFEKAVLGKEIGDEFTVKLQPKEAYGEISPENIHEFKKSELNSDNYEVGKGVAIETQHGDHTHQYKGVIIEVKKDSIVIDFNPELAGKVLNFWMKIEDIK